MSERDRVDRQHGKWLGLWRSESASREWPNSLEAFRAGAEWMRAEAVKEEALGDYRINGKLTTLRDRLSRLGTEREEGLGQ